MNQRPEPDEHPEPAGPLPLRAAVEAVVTLIVVTTVFAVFVGMLADDVSDPVRSLINSGAVQLAELVVIVWVVQRYPPLQGRRLGLGGVPLRSTVLLVFAGIVAGQASYVLFDLVLGTPEDASAAQFDTEPAATIVAVGVLFVLLGPALEEVLFRGVIFRAVRSRLTFWPAATIVSVLFALAHVPDSGGWVGFGPRLVTGLIFCGLFEWTGSLYPAIAVHVALNAIEVGRVSVPAAVAFGVLGVGCVLLAQHLASPRPRVLPDSPGAHAT